MWNLNSSRVLVDFIRALEQNTAEIQKLQNDVVRLEGKLMTTKLYAFVDFCKHLLLAYWKHATIVGLLCSAVAYFW